jgi:DNA-binding transcriptional LysR family regulator
MDLDVRLLRSFLAVVEERHLHRAAARVAISQPGLSRQMQALEARVGTPLLVRLPRGVELTEAGRVLADDARRLVDDADRALDRAQRAGRGELGHIAIGFIASAADRLMAPLLRRLLDRHPDVTFSLAERLWTHQLEGLASGADDVAFVRDMAPDDRWELLALLREPVCLVVRDDHPLADRPGVGPDDLERLQGLPMLLGAREWIAPRWDRWGFEMQIDEQIASPFALVAFVRAGFGFGVMPHSYEPFAQHLRFLPIEGELSEQQLAWPAAAARPAAQTLIALAHAENDAS